MTIETYAICCTVELWTTFLVGTNAGPTKAEAVARKSVDATAVNFILKLQVKQENKYGNSVSTEQNEQQKFAVPSRYAGRKIV